MYNFRYKSVPLGTITIQFNEQSLDNICICSRVNVNVRYKDTYDDDVGLYGEETFLYQDYIFETRDSDSTLSKDHETQDRVDNGSIAVEECDISGNTKPTRSKSSCKFLYFNTIIRVLRKGLKLRKIVGMFAKKRRLNPEVEDRSLEPVNAEPLILDEIEEQNTTQDDRMDTIEQRGKDPVEEGLFEMGFIFDADKSKRKTPFQRVTLRYDKKRIRRMNKNLILPKWSNDAVNYEEDQSQEIVIPVKRKLPNKGNAINDILPPEIQNNRYLYKYWMHRYRLFSKYDQGIRLDEESWYSVTPEKISKHLADRCCCNVIVDGFCGAGGNAIQFAFTCERVIAIDIDPRKIELAKHNAKIYKVADRIEFIVGDFFEIAPSLKADVVFLSPPWGGPNYLRQRSAPLSSIMEPYGGRHLYKTARLISQDIAFYLPRNVNTEEIIKLGGTVEIEQNIIGKKVVALTAYFNELILHNEEPDD